MKLLTTVVKVLIICFAILACSTAVQVHKKKGKIASAEEEAPEQKSEAKVGKDDDKLDEALDSDRRACLILL